MRQNITALAVFLLSYMCSFGSGRDAVRIRAIGNSFSVDAVEQHSWPLEHSVGKTVIVGNMYIPGCPLERHYGKL